MSEVMERIIGFKPTPTKNGEQLDLCTVQMIKEFNAKTETFKQNLGNNLPVKFKNNPKLELINCTNLGLDGALISPFEQINNRIWKYNPRINSNHCGDHKTQLSLAHLVGGIGEK